MVKGEGVRNGCVLVLAGFKVQQLQPRGGDHEPVMFLDALRRPVHHTVQAGNGDALPDECKK